MKKKIIRIVAILFLLILGVLVAAPFFLEAKIGEIIKNNVNKNVNATLDFSKADLSLFSSFPNAAVQLENVNLLNKAPFEGDTLFAAKNVSLTMGIMQLFNGPEEPIAITSLNLENALVNVKVDAAENANYDIAMETGAEETASSNTDSNGFKLNMESYEISNSRIFYTDMAMGMRLALKEFNHKGSGDLSLATSELDTQTSALVSFEMDSTNYLNKNQVKLDALIGIDLKENKYSFLQNEALINQLPLVFDGFVKLNADDIDVDINFKTPSSDFKNFLGLVPAEYSKNIEGVTTTGNFMLTGNFTGVVDDMHIPKFNIDINSENASFKYPDLPKSVTNINLDMAITNTTGITEDTSVDIKKASFMIDQDRFNLSSKISELMGNTKVSAQMQGKMNLANLEKAYPVPAGLSLKGMMDVDISTAFDMATLERKEYEKTRTEGKMIVTDFEYKSDEIPNPVLLKSTAVTFNPKTVGLNELNGSTGKTDFRVAGTINNFLGYLFNDEKVEGNFDLKSNTFDLGDFMVAETEGASVPNTKTEDAPTVATEKIKIPSFLDATFTAAANTVIYDNITLKDVKGNLKIKDETAVLSNMTSSLFDGKVAFNGEVSTKKEIPTFAMELNMDQLQISETFQSLELFKVLAPVAKVLQGKFSSDIQLSGNLTDDFTPDLLSLSGDILANLMAKEISAENAPVLSALDSKLNFIDLKDLDLKELKTNLSFKDGLVTVKPFAIKYKDMAINVDGNHTFDQKMNYKASIDVPSKYLGKEINALIAKIDDASLENLTIPVTANITGMYNSPQVSTDLTSGVKNLTNQLIEIEKQKLLAKGKDKAKDLIGGILSGNQDGSEDSTKTKDPLKKGAKEVLGGLLGGTKKADSTKAAADSMPPKKDDAVKDAAKDILGGLFGKKKKAEAKKDSVN
ncbi:AsmA-like C-terminal region-containing protein [Maribacter chungangensis]|uniref:AsmA-like C-terminal region-containing protein n=1 Tax=Maribacter chungangensis TaxID=1069117 RepID=A0ABW3AZU9_9FLAO